MGRTSTDIIIAASAGYISAAIHLPADLPAPVVICCHGMLSCKDTPKYIAMGKACNEAGIALIRFDFAGCGESTAPLGADLISSRLRDLYMVVRHVQSQPWSNGSIGLFGSSLGGFISLLMTGSQQVQVAAVVSWAAPYDLQRILLGPDDLDSLHDYFPEGFELGKPSNLDSAIRSVSRALIIQGERDEVVSWTEALEIYHKATDPKKLLLMEKADHRFLDNRCRDLAVRASCDWFVKHLST